MSSKLIAMSAAALMLGIASPSFAQTQSFTLMGTEVPADQVARIQAHCDALEAGEMGSASDSNSAAGTSTGTDAAAGSTDAAASTGTDAAAGAATNGTAAGTAATTGTDAAASTGTDTAAGASAAIDFATLDLATVDIEACRQGGFLEMDAGAEVGATTGTETTTTTN